MQHDIAKARHESDNCAGVVDVGCAYGFVRLDKTIPMCYNMIRRKTARPGCTTIGANSGRAVFFCGFFQRSEIMVTINGETKDVSGKTVSEILAEMQLNPARTAVMIGGEILPKDAYGSMLKDGDEVDIIGFVGGG